MTPLDYYLLKMSAAIYAYKKISWRSLKSLNSNLNNLNELKKEECASFLEDEINKLIEFTHLDLMNIEDYLRSKEMTLSFNELIDFFEKKKAEANKNAELLYLYNLYLKSNKNIKKLLKVLNKAKDNSYYAYSFNNHVNSFNIKDLLKIEEMGLTELINYDLKIKHGLFKSDLVKASLINKLPNIIYKYIYDGKIKEAEFLIKNKAMKRKDLETLIFFLCSKMEECSESSFKLVEKMKMMSKEIKEKLMKEINCFNESSHSSLKELYVFLEGELIRGSLDIKEDNLQRKTVKNKRI